MEIFLFHIRELVYPARAQEALEALDACLDEGKEVVLIAWDDASPEPDVDVALPIARVRLFAQVGDCSRRRDGVQGHVYHRCHTARSGGLSARCEALPFRSPRLIEVDCETRTQSVDRRWT